MSVNSSHCSTKWANLPPTGRSRRGNAGSGKGWLSYLCGGRGKFRGGELPRVTRLLREILFITCSNGLRMSFRPIRLRKVKFSLFSRIFGHLKSCWRIGRLMLVQLKLG